MSGICTFDNEPILSAHRGKMSWRLMGARVAVEAAGVAVRVMVTLAVAVTMPVAVVVALVAGSEVVRAVEDVVVVELSDAPVAVTVATAGVKKTVVLT
jgi:hypothetical protein